MYTRWFYVTLLAVAVAALQFTASFGGSWQPALAYVTAGGLGAVVFYHGERRVTTGPIFANVGAAIVLGTALTVLFSTGLVIFLLGAPWDLALWQMSLLSWDSSFGIAVTVFSTFFIVGFVSSIR